MIEYSKTLRQIDSFLAWQKKKHSKDASVAWRETNKEYLKSDGYRIIRAVDACRKRANKSGLECSISVEDIVIPKVCPVLGIPLVWATGKQTNNSPSIDRVDNSKGYTKDNIRVISMRANRLKSNMTIDEAELIVKYMKGEL